MVSPTELEAQSSSKAGPRPHFSPFLASSGVTDRESKKKSKKEKHSHPDHLESLHQKGNPSQTTSF